MARNMPASTDAHLLPIVPSKLHARRYRQTNKLGKVAPVLRLDGGDREHHRHDEQEHHLEECGHHDGKESFCKVVRSGLCGESFVGNLMGGMNLRKSCTARSLTGTWAAQS